MLFDLLKNSSNVPTHQVCSNSGAWIFPVSVEEKQETKIKQLADCLLDICEAINSNKTVAQETIEFLKALKG